jgi:hypothetical protein
MAPRDGFERYYAEKLWEWIPGVYRHEDGVAVHPDTLRSLIELVATQAASARRSVDRLWEDQFAETADDWALAYIGELVGTRLLNALNRRGRRADVARTIFYRRRKGTVAVLETLVRDIAGWDGVVVEAFRRLGRTPHRLDPPLMGRGAARSGLVTRTPPGGFADLRRARGGDMIDGPFEEYSRTVDVRQHRGRLGRFNIPKLNFHLFRQVAFRLPFVTPFDLGLDRYTFDPSGRDVPLFRRSRRGTGDCLRPEEWRIEAPIRCRLLGEARYVLQPVHIPVGLEPQLAPWVGLVFKDEARFRQTLSAVLTPAQFDANIFPLLAAAITEDSPKLHLVAASDEETGLSTAEGVAVSLGATTADPPIARERTIAANLETWGTGLGPPLDRLLAIDPDRGRFLLLAPPLAGTRVFVPVHFTGLFGPLGAGSYDRAPEPGATLLPTGGNANPGPVSGFALPVTGRHRFNNSKTYRPTSPAGGTMTGIEQLELQAADRNRPYVRLTPQGNGNRWTFRALPKPLGQDPDLPANRRTLVIDGLWLAIWPALLAAQNVLDETVLATPVPTVLALDGVFDQVVLRHCTIDPGGEQARLLPTQVMPIPAVQIEIVGQVEELLIEQSIVGPIREATSVFDPCSADHIIIRDSVVQSIMPDTPAIETRVATVIIERSTILGDMRVNRLEASEALVQGRIAVTDNQHGCFRFSATHDGPGVRLPRQFESHLFTPRIPNHVFVSRRFGDPGYVQLSDTAPLSLQRGAENGSEIGAWSRLLAPIKRDDLRTKVLEFMPFGLIPQFINET